MTKLQENIDKYLKEFHLNPELKGYLYLSQAILYSIENINKPNPKVLSHLADINNIQKVTISFTMKKALASAGIDIKPLDFVREATLQLARKQN